METKTIDEFTDAELAGMVRRSVYAQRAKFGPGENDSRFLLVVAVPYGSDESVDSLPRAMEGFAELFQADDWTEREFQIYDHAASEPFSAASFEAVEDVEEDDEEEDEEDDI